MRTILLPLLILASIASWGNIQKRNLSPFTEVTLRIDASVYIVQGDSQSVAITANGETLDKIVTEVRDRKLVIRYSVSDRLNSKWTPGPISIRITMPEITGLSVSGEGDILAEKTLKTRILELSLSGSGNIKLANIESEKVTATMAGSGDIIFSGNQPSKELKVVLTGTGNVRAGQFPVERSDIRITGSGYANVNVNEQLDVRILGSGSVRYYGDPNMNSTITGSGTVTKIDTPQP